MNFALVQLNILELDILDSFDAFRSTCPRVLKVFTPTSCRVPLLSMLVQFLVDLLLLQLDP